MREYDYPDSMKRWCILLFCLIIPAIFVAGCSESGPDTQSQEQAGVAGETTTETPAATPTEVQPRGEADTDFIVDITVPEKIQPGTTILADNHDENNPRIIEVNRLGEIVWEYPLTADLKAYTNPGWDVEPLTNGNILTVFPRKGVYEIDRDGQVVWKYSNSKVSHDADRLANGNTLVVFGAFDTKEDTQIKEVNQQGTIVWSWKAKDSFDTEPYASISEEGWTHANAVSRLSNGNTIVSLRNFDLIAEIDPDGELVRTIGEGIFDAQHDPVVLPDGNMLVANHVVPNEAIEMDPAGTVIWKYIVRGRGSWPVRDANRLGNGNTLITASDRIIEVTPDGEVVWQFRLSQGPFIDRSESSARGFYKAERISS